MWLQGPKYPSWIFYYSRRFPTYSPWQSPPPPPTGPIGSARGSLFLAEYANIFFLDFRNLYYILAYWELAKWNLPIGNANISILTLCICNLGPPKGKTWPPHQLHSPPSEVEGVRVVISFRNITKKQLVKTEIVSQETKQAVGMLENQQRQACIKHKWYIIRLWWQWCFICVCRRICTLHLKWFFPLNTVATWSRFISQTISHSKRHTDCFKRNLMITTLYQTRQSTKLCTCFKLNTQ